MMKEGDVREEERKAEVRDEGGNLLRKKGSIPRKERKMRIGNKDI